MKENDAWVSKLARSRRVQRLIAGLCLILVAFTLIIWSLPITKKRYSQDSSEERGHFDRLPKQNRTSSQDEEKLTFVKNMMVHAWSGYRRYAWGRDELNPISKTAWNWYGNHTLLMTPIDALDTLHIMGLTKEAQEAKDLILKNLHFDLPIEVSAFETNIRIVGGLLSGYELLGDEDLLEKAKDIANRLLPIFDTPTGIPFNSVHLMGKSTGNHLEACLAEAGTLQLEFQYLSDVTGNPIYATKALKAMDQLIAIPRGPMNLYSQNLFINKLQYSRDRFGIAGCTDSFYEYLLKLGLATGDEKYIKAYHDAADALVEHVAVWSKDRKWVTMPDRGNDIIDNFFGHLSCFSGGMFGLGALTFRRGNWTTHLDVGKRITETCYRSYELSSTGLGSESILTDTLTSSGYESYLLRPEVIESIFYMWRFTHDTKYREWGWAFAQALEKHCRTGAGYHGLTSAKYPKDRMESFFLAETLKYLYLLFTDDSVMPLDEYIFNTEAHPLSIRGYGKRASLSSKRAAEIPIKKLLKGALSNNI